MTTNKHPRFPTPTKRDCTEVGFYNDLFRRNDMHLSTVVKVFPCPNDPGYEEMKKLQQKCKQEQNPIDETKTKYPTPKCTGCAGGSGAIERLNQLEKDGIISQEEKRALQNGWNGGKLNPDWEEWLMGWPVGWTNLEPLTSLELPL